MAAIYSNFSEDEIKKIFRASRTKTEFLKKLGYQHFSNKMYNTIVKKYNLSKKLYYNVQEFMDKHGGVFTCHDCRFCGQCLPEGYEINLEKYSLGTPEWATYIQAVCRDFYPKEYKIALLKDFPDISSRNLLRPIITPIYLYNKDKKWKIDNEEFFLEHKNIMLGKDNLKNFLNIYGKEIIEKEEKK